MIPATYFGGPDLVLDPEVAVLRIIVIFFSTSREMPG
jgi:hypothetical protein